MSVKKDHRVTGNCRNQQTLAADLKCIIFADPSDCIWTETPVCHKTLVCNYDWKPVLCIRVLGYFEYLLEG